MTWRTTALSTRFRLQLRRRQLDAAAAGSSSAARRRQQRRPRLRKCNPEGQACLQPRVEGIQVRYVRALCRRRCGPRAPLALAARASDAHTLHRSHYETTLRAGDAPVLHREGLRVGIDFVERRAVSVIDAPARPGRLQLPLGVLLRSAALLATCSCAVPGA